MSLVAELSIAKGEDVSGTEWGGRVDLLVINLSAVCGLQILDDMAAEVVNDRGVSIRNGCVRGEGDRVLHAAPYCRNPGTQGECLTEIRSGCAYEASPDRTSCRPFGRIRPVAWRDGSTSRSWAACRGTFGRSRVMLNVRGDLGIMRWFHGFEIGFGRNARLIRRIGVCPRRRQLRLDVIRSRQLMKQDFVP